MKSPHLTLPSFTCEDAAVSISPLWGFVPEILFSSEEDLGLKYAHMSVNTGLPVIPSWAAQVAEWFLSTVFSHLFLQSV